MNRNRAGLLAIGVLIVAIAIVLVGGIFIRDEPASRETAAATEASRSPAAKEQQPEPEKAGAASGADAAGKPADAETAERTPDTEASPEKPKAASGESAEPVTTEPSDEMQTAARESEAPNSGEVPAPAAERTAKPVVPAFDILRVEPDGSTVIAGRAVPGAEVRIMNGDKLVTSTVAGEQGDFVAVLDKPLPPGDYELRLMAVGKNGKAVQSEEVATVSVPKDKSGELLAMVTKPGEASRIIAAPKPAGNATASSNVQPSPPAPEENSVASAAPEAGAQTVTNDDGRGSRLTDPDQVRVDAVEIEGDSLYVAGAAPPGSMVRVYADDKLVGEAEAGEEGRFVVDSRMPLTVGDHTIRADLVDPATGDVVVRAAVPFTRPEGDQFAAVAPSGTVSEARTGAGAPASAADGALSPEASRLWSEAETALSDLRAKIEAAAPSADEIAKAREKAEKSLAALANDSDADATGANADAGLRQKAKEALAMLDAMPRLSDGALPDTATMKAMRSKLPDIESALQAGNGGPAVAEAGTDSSAPKTLVQPALTGSDEVVIIRRGDTLWQIARRVYGRGVRYTTIYLANSDQISDPDLILPGQIFDVPQKPLTNSEELHRKRLQAERRG